MVHPVIKHIWTGSMVFVSSGYCFLLMGLFYLWIDCMGHNKHLTVLKDADLIRDCREGKFIFYELNTSVLEEVMLWLTALKGEEK